MDRDSGCTAYDHEAAAHRQLAVQAQGVRRRLRGHHALGPLHGGVRHGRGGGQGADAPVGHRGRRLRQRGVVEAAAAADEQAQHLRALGSELQPARRHQVEPALGLADDAGHLGMVERLLHGQQRRLARVHEHDPARVQPGLQQAVPE